MKNRFKLLGMIASVAIMGFGLASCGDGGGGGAHTVTFNTHGGSDVDRRTVADNGTLTLPAPPTRDGYTFAGWYTEPSGGQQVTAETPITGNITIHARWEPIQTIYHTVTFINGDAEHDTQQVPQGGKASAPAPEPTMANHRFAGWYDAPSGGQIFDFVNTPITGNITIHARWVPAKHTVTFDTHGGSDVPSQEVAEGEHAERPDPEPTMANHRFAGWHDAPSGGQPFDFEKTPITGSITIHARWVPAKHTVAFDTHGGSDVPSQEVAEGEHAERPDPEPTMANHRFAGWHDASSGGQIFDFEKTPITGNITIHARWVPAEHTVTFINGEAEYATERVSQGGKASAPAPEPKRDGHTFAGWYDAPSGGQIFDFVNTPITGNITIHARWVPAEHTVTFNTHGGSTVDPRTVANNGTLTLPTPPTRDGHTFAGWYTAQTGGQIFDFVNTPITGSITIHARWDPLLAEYTVTFINGDAEHATQRVPQGGQASAPAPAPTRANHRFAGWFANGDLAAEFDFDAPVTAAVTVYAGWDMQWRYVWAGANNTLAIAENGTLWGWGGNIAGQLGDNSTTNRNAPVQVHGNHDDWVAVAGHSNHTMGIRQDSDGNRTLWAWGNNVQGNLGNGMTANSLIPVQVDGNHRDWLAVSAGDGHTMAIRGVAGARGTLWGWGSNQHGRLGDGTGITIPPLPTVRRVPVPAQGGFSDWTVISVGDEHAMAIREVAGGRGTLWGWGQNTNGRLGLGDATNRDIPTQAYGSHDDWATVSVGWSHSVGIRQDSAGNRTLWAWGSSPNGQLGIGVSGGSQTSHTRHTPVQVNGGHGDWAMASAGSSHTMGIREDAAGNRTLWAWGMNVYGSLGIGQGDTASRNIPIQVHGNHNDWAMVSAGGGHTMGIRQDAAGNRTLWAWGDGANGRLGLGDTASRHVPVPVRVLTR